MIKRIFVAIVFGLLAGFTVICTTVLLIGMFRFAGALIDHRMPTELETVCAGFITLMSAIVAGIIQFVND